MCCVEVSAIEDAHGIFVLIWQVAEELYEADFIIDFEFWPRPHVAQCVVQVMCSGNLQSVGTRNLIERVQDATPDPVTGNLAL